MRKRKEYRKVKMSEYKKIYKYFTEGYSIENDILSGGKALRMIAVKHKPQWEKIIACLGSWFAAVAHRYLAGETVEYKYHPNQLVDFNLAKLKPLSEAVIIAPDTMCEVAKRVLREPTKNLRGHTLLDAFGHFLATVKQEPKCSKDVLLRMDLVSWETNDSLKRIVSGVHAAIPQVVAVTP